MRKIYRRETLPARNDECIKKEHERKRKVILNFRVTETEKELIEKRIEMSGIKKEKYLIESLLYQKILVKGNIKTFDKFRKCILEISSELAEGKSIYELDPLQVESIRIILEILNRLYGKDK